MTDTTDIKALRERLAIESNRVRDQRYVDEHCCVVNKRDLLTTVELLGKLEAERQRADAKDEAIKFAVEVARTASLKIDRLEAELAELKTDIESYINISSELATEVEALKAKLANPVVLEYRKHDGFTDPEKVRLINAVTDRCAAAIKEAGFTVKEK